MLDYVSGGDLSIDGCEGPGDPNSGFPSTTVSYDPGTDYCGPGWSSPFVPDSIGGIDIGLARYVHDINYSSSSAMDRQEADELFGLQVYALLRNGGMDQEPAAPWAATYQTAVTFFGQEHYDGQGEASYDPSE